MSTWEIAIMIFCCGVGAIGIAVVSYNAIVKPSRFSWREAWREAQRSTRSGTLMSEARSFYLEWKTEGQVVKIQYVCACGAKGYKQYTRAEAPPAAEFRCPSCGETLW